MLFAVLFIISQKEAKELLKNGFNERSATLNVISNSPESVSIVVARINQGKTLLSDH